MKWFLVFCVVLLSTESSSRSILDMENELALRRASSSPEYYNTAPHLPAYAANIFAGFPSPKPRVETTTGVYQRIANNIAEKLTTPIYRWFGVTPNKNPNVDDPYIDVLTRRSDPIETEIKIYNKDEKPRNSFKIPLPGYVKIFSTKPPKERKNYLDDPENLKVIEEEDKLQGKDKRENTPVENGTESSIDTLRQLLLVLKGKYKNLKHENNLINNDEYNNIIKNPVQDVFYNKVKPTDNDSKDKEKKDENSNSVDAESKNVENFLNNGGGEVINPEDASVNVENKKESVEQMLKYLLDLKSTESDINKNLTVTTTVTTTVTSEPAYNLTTVFDMPSTLTTRFVKIRVQNHDDLDYEELGANEGRELTFVSILELIGSAIYTAFASIGSMFGKRNNNNQR